MDMVVVLFLDLILVEDVGVYEEGNPGTDAGCAGVDWGKTRGWV